MSKPTLTKRAEASLVGPGLHISTAGTAAIDGSVSDVFRAMLDEPECYDSAAEAPPADVICTNAGRDSTPDASPMANRSPLVTDGSALNEPTSYPTASIGHTGGNATPAPSWAIPVNRSTSSLTSVAIDPRGAPALSLPSEAAGHLSLAPAALPDIDAAANIMISSQPGVSASHTAMSCLNTQSGTGWLYVTAGSPAELTLCAPLPAQPPGPSVPDPAGIGLQLQVRGRGPPGDLRHPEQELEEQRRQELEEQRRRIQQLQDIVEALERKQVQQVMSTSLLSTDGQQARAVDIDPPGVHPHISLKSQLPVPQQERLCEERGENSKSSANLPMKPQAPQKRKRPDYLTCDVCGRPKVALTKAQRKQLKTTNTPPPEESHVTRCDNCKCRREIHTVCSNGLKPPNTCFCGGVFR